MTDIANQDNVPSDARLFIKDADSGSWKVLDRYDGLPGSGVPLRKILKGWSPDMITNGAFGSDTIWTKGTGWTIGAGVASHGAGNEGTVLYQDPDAEKAVLPPIKASTKYLIGYTVTAYTSGGVAVSVGGTSGTSRTATGTFYEEITTIADVGAAATQRINFTADATDGFVGSIDNVTMREYITNGIFKLYPLGDAEETIILDTRDAWDGYLEFNARTLTSSGASDLDGMVFNGRSGYYFDQLSSGVTISTPSDVALTYPVDPGATNEVEFASAIDMSAVGAVSGPYSIAGAYFAAGVTAAKFSSAGLYVLAGTNASAAGDDLGTILISVWGR